MRLEGSTATPFELTGTPVLALARDRGGVVYAGTELGLFQLQPGSGHWYWYAGADASDQVPDWQRFLPDAEGDARNFPAEEDVFLPAGARGAPRRRTRRSGSEPSTGSPATSLGRREGSRTRPSSRRFPISAPGPVHAIAEDARGFVWFATDRGVLPLRRARPLAVPERTRAGCSWAAPTSCTERPSSPRGSWRFARGSGQWQRLQISCGPPAWVPFTDEPRTTDEPTVRCIAWTDEAVADLLGEGEPEPVDDADLVVRYKPSETRIVDGGIPAIPRLPAGTSTWRYLALEGEETTEPDAAPRLDARGTAVAAPAGPRMPRSRAASTCRRRRRRACSTTPCSRSGPPRAFDSSGARAGRSACLRACAGERRTSISSRRCSTASFRDWSKYGPRASTRRSRSMRRS